MLFRLGIYSKGGGVPKGWIFPNKVGIRLVCLMVTVMIIVGILRKKGAYKK